MAKFDDYGILAEKYYVEEQLPVSRIAEKLGLTDKTLHEWKKNYVDPYVLDGTQWSLELGLTGNRKRNYFGSNDYPPYWTELKKVFRPFAKQ